MDINLKELSDKSGRTEVEFAKTIITLLKIKSEVYDIPQKVICYFRGGVIGN